MFIEHLTCERNLQSSHQQLPFPTAIISEFTRIVPVNSLRQSGVKAHNHSDSLRTRYSRREEFSMAEIAGMGNSRFYIMTLLLQRLNKCPFCAGPAVPAD